MKENWNDSIVYQKCVIEPRNKLNDHANNIVNNAKIFCPVDTGRLRNSIRILGRIEQTNVYIIQIGTDVFYSKFVEFGTRNNLPQPYLIPAADLEFMK